MRKVYVDTGRTTQKKEYEKFSVESSFVQMYIDINELFFKIGSPCGMQLMIWIVTQMNSYNQVNLNKNMRSEFSSSCRSNGGKAYSDGTIKNAIRDLQNANAIVSMSDPAKRESQYMVNPNFYWKTKSQKDRIEAIKGYKYQLKEKK